MPLSRTKYQSSTRQDLGRTHLFALAMEQNLYHGQINFAMYEFTANTSCTMYIQFDFQSWPVIDQKIYSSNFLSLDSKKLALIHTLNL